MDVTKAAKTFFIDQWNDEKHLIHCDCVRRACLRMVEGTTIEKNPFIIAAWIHDLGKLKDKATHHEKSMSYLDKFLEQHPENKKHYDIIKDCILNHRTNGKPDSLHAKIFQIADKVALYDEVFLEFKKKSQ